MIVKRKAVPRSIEPSLYDISNSSPNPNFRSRQRGRTRYVPDSQVDSQTDSLRALEFSSQTDAPAFGSRSGRNNRFRNQPENDSNGHNLERSKSETGTRINYNGDEPQLGRKIDSNYVSQRFQSRRRITPERKLGISNDDILNGDDQLPLADITNYQSAQRPVNVIRGRKFYAEKPQANVQTERPTVDRGRTRAFSTRYQNTQPTTESQTILADVNRFSDRRSDFGFADQQFNNKNRANTGFDQIQPRSDVSRQNSQRNYQDLTSDDATPLSSRGFDQIVPRNDPVSYFGRNQALPKNTNRQAFSHVGINDKITLSNTEEQNQIRSRNDGGVPPNSRRFNQINSRTGAQFASRTRSNEQSKESNFAQNFKNNEESLSKIPRQNYDRTILTRQNANALPLNNDVTFLPSTVNDQEALLQSVHGADTLKITAIPPQLQGLGQNSQQNDALSSSTQEFSQITSQNDVSNSNQKRLNRIISRNGGGGGINLSRNRNQPVSRQPENNQGTPNVSSSPQERQNFQSRNEALAFTRRRGDVKSTRNEINEQSSNQARNKNDDSGSTATQGRYHIRSRNNGGFSIRYRGNQETENQLSNNLNSVDPNQVLSNNAFQSRNVQRIGQIPARNEAFQQSETPNRGSPREQELISTQRPTSRNGGTYTRSRTRVTTGTDSSISNTEQYTQVTPRNDLLSRNTPRFGQTTRRNESPVSFTQSNSNQPLPSRNDVSGRQKNNDVTPNYESSYTKAPEQVNTENEAYSRSTQRFNLATRRNDVALSSPQTSDRASSRNDATLSSRKIYDQNTNIDYSLDNNPEFNQGTERNSAFNTRTTQRFNQIMQKSNAELPPVQSLNPAVIQNNNENVFSRNQFNNQNQNYDSLNYNTQEQNQIQPRKETLSKNTPRFDQVTPRSDSEFSTPQVSLKNDGLVANRQRPDELSNAPENNPGSLRNEVYTSGSQRFNQGTRRTDIPNTNQPNFDDVSLNRDSSYSNAPEVNPATPRINANFRTTQRFNQATRRVDTSYNNQQNFDEAALGPDSSFSTAPVANPVTSRNNADFRSTQRFHQGTQRTDIPFNNQQNFDDAATLSRDSSNVPEVNPVTSRNNVDSRSTQRFSANFRNAQRFNQGSRKNDGDFSNYQPSSRNDGSPSPRLDYKDVTPNYEESRSSFSDANLNTPRNDVNSHRFRQGAQRSGAPPSTSQNFNRATETRFDQDTRRGDPTFLPSQTDDNQPTSRNVVSNRQKYNNDATSNFESFNSNVQEFNQVTPQNEPYNARNIQKFNQNSRRGGNSFSTSRTNNQDAPNEFSFPSSPALSQITSNIDTSFGSAPVLNDVTPRNDVVRSTTQNFNQILSRDKDFNPTGYDVEISRNGDSPVNNQRQQIGNNYSQKNDQVFPEPNQVYSRNNDVNYQNPEQGQSFSTEVYQSPARTTTRFSSPLENEFESNQNSRDSTGNTLNSQSFVYDNQNILQGRNNNNNNNYHRSSNFGRQFNQIKPSSVNNDSPSLAADDGNDFSTPFSSLQSDGSTENPSSQNFDNNLDRPYRRRQVIRRIVNNNNNSQDRKLESAPVEKQNFRNNFRVRGGRTETSTKSNFENDVPLDGQYEQQTGRKDAGSNLRNGGGFTGLPVNFESSTISNEVSFSSFTSRNPEEQSSSPRFRNNKENAPFKNSAFRTRARFQTEAQIPTEAFTEIIQTENIQDGETQFPATDKPTTTYRNNFRRGGRPEFSGQSITNYEPGFENNNNNNKDDNKYDENSNALNLNEQNNQFTNQPSLISRTVTPSSFSSTIPKESSSTSFTANTASITTTTTRTTPRTTITTWASITTPTIVGKNRSEENSEESPNYPKEFLEKLKTTKGVSPPPKNQEGKPSSINRNLTFKEQLISSINERSQKTTQKQTTIASSPPTFSATVPRLNSITTETVFEATEPMTEKKSTFSTTPSSRRKYSQSFYRKLAEKTSYSSQPRSGTDSPKSAEGDDNPTESKKSAGPGNSFRKSFKSFTNKPLSFSSLVESRNDQSNVNEERRRFVPKNKVSQEERKQRIALLREKLKETNSKESLVFQANTYPVPDLTGFTITGEPQFAALTSVSTPDSYTDENPVTETVIPTTKSSEESTSEELDKKYDLITLGTENKVTVIYVGNNSVNTSALTELFPSTTSIQNFESSSTTTTTTTTTTQKPQNEVDSSSTTEGFSIIVSTSQSL